MTDAAVVFQAGRHWHYNHAMTNLVPAQDTLSVLMIDDDQELYAMVAELLGREGMLTEGAATAAAGMAALRARRTSSCST